MIFDKNSTFNPSIVFVDKNSAFGNRIEYSIVDIAKRKNGFGCIINAKISGSDFMHKRLTDEEMKIFSDAFECDNIVLYVEEGDFSMVFDTFKVIDVSVSDNAYFIEVSSDDVK